MAAAAPSSSVSFDWEPYFSSIPDGAERTILHELFGVFPRYVEEFCIPPAQPSDPHPYQDLRRRTVALFERYLQAGDPRAKVSMGIEESRFTNPIASCNLAFDEEGIVSCLVNRVTLLSELYLTEAPTPASAEGFWKIVSACKIGKIVDLTTRVDQARGAQLATYRDIGCHLPTPEQPFVRDSVRVEAAALREGAAPAEAWATRTSCRVINKASSSWEVERIHFNRWPDHGVLPLDEFVALVDRVYREWKEENLRGRAFLIHCVGGFGRSVTLTAALAARHLRETRHPRFLDQTVSVEEIALTTVLALREQRSPCGIQTVEQYMLLVQYIDRCRSAARSDEAPPLKKKTDGP
jgi:protein tyrosine phosphatase